MLLTACQTGFFPFLVVHPILVLFQGLGWICPRLSTLLSLFCVPLKLTVVRKSLFAEIRPSTISPSHPPSEVGVCQCVSAHWVSGSRDISDSKYGATAIHSWSMLCSPRPLSGGCGLGVMPLVSHPSSRATVPGLKRKKKKSVCVYSPSKGKASVKFYVHL